MYFKILFFLFLIGCKSTTPSELEVSPTLKTKIQPKDSVKSSRTSPLLIRKMGKHGVVLGGVGMNINPLDENLDDGKNQELIRKSIIANQEIFAVGNPLKKHEPTTLTGRSRIECGELLVELSGGSEESEGDIFVLSNDVFEPGRFRSSKSAKTTDRFRKALKTTDFNLELYEADLKGDGRTEHIAVVQGSGEAPDFSFVSVRVGDIDSKKGYQKGVRLMDESALEGPHYVSLLGVADLDMNRTIDLIVLHSDPGAHFHKLVVYEWEKGLNPILDYTWGERDCKPNFNVWPERESVK